MLYQAKFWLNHFLGKFSQEEGQGLVEYALIIVLIAIVVILALGPLGDEIADVFENITTELGATGEN